MLQDQIPQGVMSRHELSAVNMMTNFVILFYGKAFLQSAIPATAPGLDLKFRWNMIMYQGYAQELVDAVIPSIYRHMWYNSDEFGRTSFGRQGFF